MAELNHTSANMAVPSVGGLPFSLPSLIPRDPSEVDAVLTTGAIAPLVGVS